MLITMITISPWPCGGYAIVIINNIMGRYSEQNDSGESSEKERLRDSV